MERKRNGKGNGTAQGRRTGRERVVGEEEKDESMKGNLKKEEDEKERGGKVVEARVLKGKS